MLSSVEVIEPAEEQCTEVIGTSTGNGLDAANAVFGDGRGIGTENKTSSGGGEFWKTSDRKVLVVESGIAQQNLSGLVTKWESRGSITHPHAVASDPCELTFLTTGKTQGLELSSR